MTVPSRITKLSQPEAASAKNLIAVAFPKSPSKSYPMIVAVAKKALSYGEVILGDKMFHYSVFGRNKTQTSKAIVVLDAVKDWKHTRIFVGGRILERHYNVMDTLRCYLDSLESIDTKSYCNGVYTDYSGDFSLLTPSKKTLYYVPCRQLEGFVGHMLRYPIGGPEADFQALAIRRGCFWCPNFNPKGFRQIKV